MDDYYTKENQAKRKAQADHLASIENQITQLMIQYNKYIDEECMDNWDIRKQYIIYSLVENVPYGWNTNGPTHIGEIAETFETNPGWLSSSEKC